MEKIILSVLISILPFTQLSHPQEEDPFTTYIQEKLIELGYLEVANGVNDKTSQSAIKLFQEKYGLIVDGMVGEQTFTKLLLGEAVYQTPESTSKQIEETNSPTIDTLAPVWDEEQPPYASEIGSLFYLNMPAVTDNVGIVSYEVFVNGALSTYATISDSTLLVTPKYDMTCADQLIYVIAFDEAGNSSQSPTFTIPQSDPCISAPSTVNSSQSNSSSQISSQSFAVYFGNRDDDDAQDVVVDSVGNTYITGHFRQTVDFGGGNITSGGHRDIYVLKVDSTGAFEWVQTYGSTSNLADRGLDIDIDSSSNVYITGYFQGTVDFGNGDITASGGSDIFVLKLDSSGAFQWVYTAGGAGNDNGKGIAVDTDGNVLLTGIFSQTVDFGGGTVTSETDSLEKDFDFFVLKLNSAGAYQWVYTAGSDRYDSEGLSIDTDSNNNSYITGYVGGVVDFGVTHNFYGDTEEASVDAFVLKLNSEGVPQWANRYGLSQFEIGNGIAVDSSGNSYIAGEHYSNTNFGGITATNNGGTDYFVLKLNSDGVSQWVYSVSSSATDIAYDIAIDSSGNSYTTGKFAGTINFGSESVTANVQDDIFVLKLDSSGTFQWVYTAGGIAGTSLSNDIGYGIAVDSSGNVYTAGVFVENIELTTGVNIEGEVNPGALKHDALVFKLNSSGQYSD